MHHPTKVHYHHNRDMSGLDWIAKCRHGDCRFRAHCADELSCKRIADAHDQYHTARWAS